MKHSKNWGLGAYRQGRIKVQETQEIQEIKMVVAKLEHLKTTEQMGIMQDH